MKKMLPLIFALVLFSLTFVACTGDLNNKENEKLTVVATLFPQYDFAREVAGEYANISLLLLPGIESHAYEPTPQDIIKINDADVFLYTGEYMEAWAHEIAQSIESDVLIVDVSQGISLDTLSEHSHGDSTGSEHYHGNFDPHIWTDPTLAKVMVKNIAEAFETADQENAAIYENNALSYTEKLDKLDADMNEMLSLATKDTICFGDRFAMHYFAKHYGLNYISAYDSCSHETEPSAKAITDIIDTMNENGIKTVYYAELTEPTVARAISEETGADILLLHSCHNVSKTEFESGATYLSLMYQNLENLREGLK